MTPNQPSRLTRLDRGSIAGPQPTGRYADPPKHPTGGGERTLPEKMTSWGYHITDGFQMNDFAFGRVVPKTVREGLEKNGFAMTPSRVIGSGTHRMEVYDRINTVEHLVIVYSEGLEQLVVCRNFPSLMEYLRLYAPVVEKCHGGEEGGGEDATPPARNHANTAAAGERYSVHVANAVGAEHLTLEKALSLTPKASPAVIVRDGSSVPLYQWLDGRWQQTEAGGLAVGTARPSESRYRVIAPENRLIKEGVTLQEVLAMKNMPHDCHNAKAFLIGDPDGVPILVYNGPRGEWVDPD
jgi:hypothetical protein